MFFQGWLKYHEVSELSNKLIAVVSCWDLPNIETNNKLFNLCNFKWQRHIHGLSPTVVITANFLFPIIQNHIITLATFYISSKTTHYPRIQNFRRNIFRRCWKPLLCCTRGSTQALWTWIWCMECRGYSVHLTERCPSLLGRYIFNLFLWSLTIIR